MEEIFNKENEIFVREIQSKDSFIFSWCSGGILPINHPHFYDGRIDIKLKKAFGNLSCSVNIERNTYEISEKKFNEIKYYIVGNIMKLVMIALNQNNEMIDGAVDNICIKYKSLYINISTFNVISQEEKDYLEKFEKEIKNMIISNDERIDDSLKLSNGRYAADEETKREFDNYMNKVEKYNEQVENGQVPDVKMGDLLNQYRETFYDESLEKKIKKIEDDFKKRAKDTELDDLINKIDEKLDESNNKESFNCPICGERLRFMIPEGSIVHCKKCNKYFINENGQVGEETTYPYTEKNADY